MTTSVKLQCECWFAKRTFFIGGNWKMNGNRGLVTEAARWLGCGPINPDVEVVIAVPAVYVEYAMFKFPRNVAVAAQNCYTVPEGDFTGEHSAHMLRDVGCEWVIVGHSERRLIFEESEDLIAEKIEWIQDAGISAIVCVGEQLEDRENGETTNVIMKQLKPVIDAVWDWYRIVIAYEPVWAIGTGRTATPDEAQKVHRMIRDKLHDLVSAEIGAYTRIIYGGSVTAENCKELAKKSDIDGFLVGGASLEKDFLKIINCTAGF